MNKKGLVGIAKLSSVGFVLFVLTFFSFVFVVPALATTAPTLTMNKTVSPSSLVFGGNATITFTLNGSGTPAITRNNLDVMILLDKSGSMSGDKITQAKNASKTFIDQLNSTYDRVGLVGFSHTGSDSNAYLYSALTTNYASVKSTIDGLSADAGTNTGDAIAKSNAQLTSSTNVKVEILLSDGLPTLPSCGGNTPCQADMNFALSYAQQAKNNNTVIYTISLGSDANRTFMQQIANLTGGKEYFAPSPSDLQNIFLNISKDVKNLVASSAVITDVLPVGVTPTNLGPSCSYNSTTRTVSCTVGVVKINDSLTLSFNVTVSDSSLTHVNEKSYVSYVDYQGSPSQINITVQPSVVIVCPAGWSGSSCNIPVCGDGLIRGTEICDSNSQSCSAGGYTGTQSCNSQCSGWNVCQTIQYCGDGQVNGNETCDDGASNGLPNHCNSQCTGATVATCGNGIIESGEQCESPFGSCCNASTCQFESTQTVCRSSSGQCDVAETCTGSDALCPSNSFQPAQTACNDGLWCSATDECDGSGNCVQATPRSCLGNDIPGISTCFNIPDSISFTYDFRNTFTSSCVENGSNTGYCTSGNEIITHTCSKSDCGAQCESGNSQSCTTNDGYSGSQDCSSGCTWNSCSSAEYCGDGVTNGPETCDSNSQSCTTDGGYSGTQTCSSGCDGFETCSTSEYCGDGVQNGFESCDSGSNNSQPNYCNAQCTGLTSSTCGNSITEAGEACDDGSNNGVYGYCNSFCSGATLDITDPVTTDDAPSGWQSNDVAVTLTCTDTESGCYQTNYSTDGGSSWNTGNSIVVSGEGNSTIFYYSVDNAGNVETPTKTTTVQVDKSAPTVTITMPVNGTSTNDNTVSNLNFAVTDNLDNVIDYTIYVDGVVDATGSISNGGGIGTSISSQPDGIHNISIKVADDAGNTASDSIIVIIDTTTPVLELYSPNSTQDTLTTNILYDVFDPNVDTVWYEYNGVNTTLTGNTTFTGIEGTNNLTLWANDTSGNVNSTTFLLTIALPAPPQPPGGGGGGGGGCTYNWTCSDWNICQSGGIQTRSCINTGTCSSSYSPPAINQSCTYNAISFTPNIEPTPQPGINITNETNPIPPTNSTSNGITGFLTAGEAGFWALLLLIIFIILFIFRKRIAALFKKK